MTPEAQKLRDRLHKLEAELVQAEQAVEALERFCGHIFSMPVRDDLVRPEYRTLAPHWHPGYGREEDSQVYVPEERTPRWRRTCTMCGMVQYTTAIDKQVTISPRF